MVSCKNGQQASKRLLSSRRGMKASPPPIQRSASWASVPANPMETKSTRYARKQANCEHAKPYNGDSTLPLYMISDVPMYLRDNGYILRGYRAYYTGKQCVTSVLRMHNETINIWTHLLGVLVFLGMVVQLFTQHIIPEYLAGNVFHRENRTATPVHVSGARTRLPFIIFGAFSFSCVMCMLCSACFHTFLCHMSEEFYHRMHALDYYAITLLVVGSFLPFCFYAMHCAPAWRNAYLSMISSFGVVGLIGPFFRHWTSEAFATKKIIFYVCMVGSGIIPTIHISQMIPLDISAPYVKGLLTMLALYGFGVFVYAFRIPEAISPGTFDFYFSSHQIWHVCVLGAAITHFYNCVAMYLNRGTIVCV
ncbi:hypothetical protein LPMP_355630 [Leishmania panamensis]|uniref:Adiponectin receptor protein 1 n=1 Tax=Leishmania panamensis TaxID=5679 RepID=A0A088S3A1_LEIPA|nr:hypothetical protein LPMP_355630 [Leishmania panamensis]AIO02694.1 hypothetical protein LPMP_355630 [Leishmania panamensis]